MKHFIKGALFISLVYVSCIAAQNAPQFDGFDEDLLFEIDETDTSDKPIELVDEDVSISNRLHDIKEGIYDMWETSKFMGDIAKNIVKNVWLEKKYDWYGEVDPSIMQKSLIMAGTSIELIRMLGGVAFLSYPFLKKKVDNHLQRNAIRYMVGIAVITALIAYKKCDEATFHKVIVAESIAGTIIAALRMWGVKDVVVEKKETIDSSNAKWAVIKDDEIVDAGIFEEEKDSNEERY